MKYGDVLARTALAAILVSGSCRLVPPLREHQSVTAVLSAFEKEIIILQDQLTDVEQRRIEAMSFVTGRLHGRRLVTAWTGIGKVNAAMTATLLLEHYKPDEVIFTGIAGAVNPTLGPGDIVIAKQTAYHDMGLLTPTGLDARPVMNPFTGMRNPPFFPADARLLELAAQAAGRVKLDIIETSVGPRSPHILKGVIVTGDVFVASPGKSAELRDDFAADAVEMEGAAVAQICYQKEVPHLVIRSISDKADEQALSDAVTFSDMAAKNSAALISEMIRLIGSEGFVDKTQKTAAVQ